MDMETIFGDVLMGTWDDDVPTQQVKANIQTLSVNQLQYRDAKLNATLMKFWELEEPSKVAPLFTPEEQRVLDEYQETHSFVKSEGRYQVTLPRNKKDLQLGDSRTIAKKRYLSNERALLRNKHYPAFQRVVEEYFELNHARRVTAAELLLPETQVFYLPMHGVHRASSSTTKLRVVFDASCKSSSGVSLNDTLAVGPMLHPTLEQILIKFRTYKVALSGDISKMFREVLLSPADQNYHRFLWRAKPDQELQEHCMQRVTFGVASSPFLAVQTLQQSAKDFGEAQPEAQHQIKSHFYVDDLLGGAETETEAVDQITMHYARGGHSNRLCTNTRN